MTALNIVNFDAKAQAKANVVDMAKDILAQAERGELVDLSFAAALADGGIRSGFTSTEDGPRRLAAVCRLLHRLNDIMDGDVI